MRLQLTVCSRDNTDHFLSILMKTQRVDKGFLQSSEVFQSMTSTKPIVADPVGEKPMPFAREVTDGLTALGIVILCAGGALYVVARLIVAGAKYLH